MDTSNLRSLESGNWRSQVKAASRQRMVNRIRNAMKRHYTNLSGHEPLKELEKIIVRFEEKIYTVATSPSDYLCKISLKMQTLENRSHNPMIAANSVNPSNPGSLWMQQVNIQGLPLPIGVPFDHPQHGQQLLSSHTMHNTIVSTSNDSSMEVGDWRAQLQADSRQRIVNKILDTLKRHLPFSGHEGLHELMKIAVRFEDKIYTDATSQVDYLRKISLKMLAMENRSSQNPIMPQSKN